MLILDFTKPRKKAFANGFLKGLGAPFVLYGRFEAGPIPQFQPIQPQVLPASLAISRDWGMIAHDLDSAVTRYGKENTGSAK